MNTQSNGDSRTSPKQTHAALLRPMAEVEKESCGGGCRGKVLTRLNREGMSACQSGDFADAGRLLAEGIDLARRGGISMYEAKLRNNLGLVFLLADQPEDAAREFGQALALVEEKLGRDNKLYQRIEGNLARAARD